MLPNTLILTPQSSPCVHSPRLQWVINPTWSQLQLCSWCFLAGGQCQPASASTCLGMGHTPVSQDQRPTWAWGTISSHLLKGPAHQFSSLCIIHFPSIGSLSCWLGPEDSWPFSPSSYCPKSLFFKSKPFNTSSILLDFHSSPSTCSWTSPASTETYTLPNSKVTLLF